MASVAGKYLYGIFDKTLGGFITWRENKPKPVGEVAGILLFTTGVKAEAYIEKVMPLRVGLVKVVAVARNKMCQLVNEMMQAGIDYALVDVPPIAVDQLSEGIDKAETLGDDKNDLIRHYGIVDLRKVVARLL